MGPVAAALRLAGYAGEFGASDGFFNMETISTYAAQLDGAWVASSLPPIDRIPSAVSLITDFQREIGAITLFSQYGYAAAQLIISAAQIAGAASRTNVLRSLQRGGSYTTLAGQFSFSYSGDPLIPNIYLYVVGKDGFRYLRPAVRTGFVL
jgi:ABC-type branched-subunit amino acid transport system substrate-binding protein